MSYCSTTLSAISCGPFGSFSSLLGSSTAIMIYFDFHAHFSIWFDSFSCVLYIMTLSHITCIKAYQTSVFLYSAIWGNKAFTSSSEIVKGRANLLYPAIWKEFWNRTQMISTFLSETKWNKIIKREFSSRDHTSPK